MAVRRPVDGDVVLRVGEVGVRESRQFGLACNTDPGIGNWDWAYSPPVGNRFRLLKVSLWYGGGYGASPCGGTVYLKYGFSEPANVNVMLNTWEDVLPMWAGQIKPTWVFQGIDCFLHWDFYQEYVQQTARFGLYIENFSADRGWWVNVWFQIARG